MAQIVLLDAGPLVAALDQREKHHRWVLEKLMLIKEPLYTCESVLTEASFLLSPYGKAHRQMKLWIEAGYIRVQFDFMSHHAEVFKLMEMYKNIPMSLADACLVCMSDLFSKASIFTLDRDFTLYRKRGKGMIPLIYPYS